MTINQKAQASGWVFCVGLKKNFLAIVTWLSYAANLKGW
jgi:hypothetical protein